MQSGDIPVYGGNGVNGYHNVGNVNEPTIVIGRVGYYCGSIHLTPSNAWVTDNAFITKYCQEAIYREFLILLLKGTNLKENENATAQPVISGSKIYPIAVALPPFSEQQRIVAKVDELLTLCDLMKTKIRHANQTQAHLAAALVEKAVV
jgi:type I restriction enzyme S subunit